MSGAKMNHWTFGVMLEVKQEGGGQCDAQGKPYLTAE